MKRLAVFLVLMPCLLCACTATQALDSYERDELVSVKYNPKTDCTLLTYRDSIGQTRHVFRKHGVFELGLAYTLAGDFILKERGHHERRIEAVELSRVRHHINNQLQVKQQRSEQLSSI